MEEKESQTAENYCASCGCPIPPGTVTCPKCSETRTARKRVVNRSSEEGSENVSVLRVPEEGVRRGVAMGLLRREEGELLLLLLARRHLLDFSVRSVLTSLITEIAQERDVQKREDRVYILREFVNSTMPTEDLVGEVSRTFQLR